MRTTGKVRLILLVIVTLITTGATHIWGYEWYICIDAGHGGTDNGATGRYWVEGQEFLVFEKEVNLKVAKAIEDTLRYLDSIDTDHEFHILLTRITDVFLDHEQRAQISNYQDEFYPSDIFVSVHHNSVVDTTAQGTEVIWSSKDTTVNTSMGPMSRENKDLLAARLYAELQERFESFKHHGNRCYDVVNMRPLKYVYAYSGLTEAQFISYPPEARLYDDTSSVHIENEAGAIARGIKHYIDDDPFVRITSNIPALEFVVEDSLYVDTYYGNWFVGEEYYVAMPGTWGDRNFCRWLDAAEGPGRTIYCCSEDNYVATYLTHSSISVYSPTQGQQVEEGQSLEIRWLADYDDEFTRSRSVLLSRDGGATYPWAIVNSQPISAPGHGSDQWTAAPPYSDNCRILVHIFDDFYCMQDWDTTGVFSILPPPTPVPTGLYTATCGTDFRIQFFWDPVADIDSYLVYRDNAWVATKPAGITEHVDYWMTPCGSYEYGVEAVRFGRASDRAGPEVGETGAGLPAAPSNLQVTDLGDCIYRFTWNDNSVCEHCFEIRIAYYDDQGYYHEAVHMTTAGATQLELQFAVDNVDATAAVYAADYFMPCTFPYTPCYIYSGPSNTVNVSNGSCPHDGCPVLSVFDGQGFVEDNTILALSETKIGESVPALNRYLVDRPLRPDANGHYRISIAETEKEISEVDRVGLIGLRGPEDENIGLLADGTPVTYSVSRIPTSCVDHRGLDILDVVSAKDNRSYAFENRGYIIAEFVTASPEDMPKATVPCGLDDGGGIDPGGKGDGPPCPDKLNPNIGDSVGNSGNMLTVEILKPDNTWEFVAQIPPRARNTGPIFFDLSQYLAESNNITLKYSWEYRYSVDQVALYDLSESEITETPGQVVEALNLTGQSLVSSLENVDSTAAVLHPDEAWEMTFAFDDDKPFDAFILESYGFYSPSLAEWNGSATDTATSSAAEEEPWISNTPNPFNAGTQIDFYLPRSSYVRLMIYDVLGRHVITLIDDKLPESEHSVDWPAVDESGERVASGIYLCKLQTENRTMSHKMSLVK